MRQVQNTGMQEERGGTKEEYGGEQMEGVWKESW